MATETATKPAKPERDAKGRFIKGNSGGPGNPFGRRLAQARSKFHSLVKPEHLEMVYDAILKSAREGNLGAQKLYVQYAIGKPTVARDPDLSDIEEWEIFTAATNSQNANPHVSASPDHRFGLEIAREMRPVMAEEARKKLLEGFAEDEEREREMQRVEDEWERQQAEAAKAAAENEPVNETYEPVPTKDAVPPSRQSSPVDVPWDRNPLVNGVFPDRDPLLNGVFADGAPSLNGFSPGVSVADITVANRIPPSLDGDSEEFDVGDR